jgi:hypothetical protein
VHHRHRSRFPVHRIKRMSHFAYNSRQLTILALHLKTNAYAIIPRCWRSPDGNARFYINWPGHLGRSL